MKTFAAKIILIFCALGLIGVGLYFQRATRATSKLKVQFHHQEHELSCEVAALKMALDYSGVVLSEADIIKKMHFDRTPKSKEIWGDPDLGFVGDINGVMLKTGYGIHASALSKLAEVWCSNHVISDGAASDLATLIAQGIPVIIWGFHHVNEGLTWKTNKGRMIKANAQEHVRVVYGFEGSANSPAGFYLMDPMDGPIFWKTEELVQNWSSFDRVGLYLECKKP